MVLGPEEHGRLDYNEWDVLHFDVIHESFWIQYSS